MWKIAAVLEIEKLIRMFLDRTSSGAQLLPKLLSGLAAIVTLSIVMGVMMGAVIVGLMFVLFRTMVNHGMEVWQALLILGLTNGVIIAILLAVITSYIRKLRDMSCQLLSRDTASSFSVSPIILAFLEGLFASGQTKKKPSRSAPSECKD